jgi:hypothetical protein
MDKYVCYIYMQDLVFFSNNNLKYLSKYIKDWLLALEFQIIWHPSQSPNLNPIELLRNEVDCGMGMSEKKLTNKKNLWEKLQEIWYSINIHIVKKLIMYMLQKVVDFYQAKGDYTHTGGHHECMVVMPLSYEVVFIAHGSIFYS